MPGWLFKGGRAKSTHSTQKWAVISWTDSLKGITNFNYRIKLYDQLLVNEKRHTTSQVLYTTHEKLNIEKSLHCQKQQASLQPKQHNNVREDTWQIKISCISPTMQASGQNWGHVGKSGQHDITMRDTSDTRMDPDLLGWWVAVG